MAPPAMAVHWLPRVGLYLLAVASFSNALPAYEGTSLDLPQNVTSSELLARSLSKRALTSAQVLSIYRASGTVQVTTDDSNYLDCSKGPYPKYIGTSGLNGCTGIAICSNQGCALIHVLPDLEATANYKWKTLINNMFSAHPDLKGTSAVLGAYMKPSGLWYAWEVGQIQSLLQDTYQVRSSVQEYWEYYGTEEDFKELFDGDGDSIPETSPQNFIYNEAAGTVLVQCTSATEHEIYVAGVQNTS